MNAAAIRAALNSKKNGINGTYKNRIASGVANAVVKARKANIAVAAANLGAKPETDAAAAVQQATNAMNNLNRAIANINTTNFANNAAKNAYKTKLMNIVKAKGIALNNARITAAFNKLNAKALKKANNTATQTPRANNNNMAIVNRAIATKELSELSSAKLLNATANKLKNSNNKNLKRNFVNFAKRQINEMKNENNKKKVRSAIMKVSPENNMFKQANNAANNAKNKALQQGKTEQTANANAARAAAQTAVENAPANASANAIRQAAKAATLNAGATPAAASNASKMVTQKLNEKN